MMNPEIMGIHHVTAITADAQKNVDFSIVKFVPITEQQKVEFRTEFFNLFNHPNFANPVNVITAPGNAFGSIVKTATGPRVVQFAFKYSF